MKQWLKKRKGRGFTLVELLIVIVIIGILAGSLLLVMGSGTDKANATKIASDLRTIKAAMLMYYADNNNFFTATDLAADPASLDNYLDRTPSSNLGTYRINLVSEDYYAVFENSDANSNVIDLLKEIEGITDLSGDLYGTRIGR